MQQTTIRISKSTQVEDQLTFSEWCKTYNVGSRIPKISRDCDMYKSKDYNFDKLAVMIKNKNKTPNLYDRILKAITA